MLLTIDVGNTNVVVGLWPGGEDPAREEICASWRFASVRERTPDEWHAVFEPLVLAALGETGHISGVVMSSVVPAITRAIHRWARDRLGFEPLHVSPDLELGIQVRTDAPHETGADRIANCAAAYARFGGPTIVVDAGTATKIEAITADGVFVGGVIAPGPGVTLEALASRAARLYAVELRLPETAIGRNTVSAVQSGVVAGHLALIEGMVSRVRDELGGARHIVLTGGFADIFAPAKSCFTDYVPHLTLIGLRLIWHWNRWRAAAPPS